MIFSYLSNQTHQTKINECFSGRSRIEHGVPQGSVFRPLIFNIDQIYLFYEHEEGSIASYADDTTPYSCLRNTQTVISELKFIFNKRFNIINILKPILENVIYVWVPKSWLMYLLLILHLQVEQKKPYV